MADDRQITPEKQLLSLIEGKESEGGKSPLEAARTKRSTLNALSFGSLFGRLSFFKRATKKKMSAPSKFSISFVLVNRVLLVAVISFAVYVVGDTVASALSLAHLPNIVPQGEKIGPGSEGKVSPLKEESYYIEKVNSRDIFKEYKEADQRKEKKEAPASENEAMKNLSLVGISWSADPDVIIEDKSQQKTYFVKRGQTVGNGVKVEAVFKDKVVLSVEGQEYELR
jgi:hypothetical protein